MGLPGGGFLRHGGVEGCWKTGSPRLQGNKGCCMGKWLRCQAGGCCSDPLLLACSSPRAFLQDVVSQSPCEVLLVVPRAVEEAGSWLSPE